MGRKSGGELTEAGSTMSRLMTQIMRQIGENKERIKSNESNTIEER